MLLLSAYSALWDVFRLIPRERISAAESFTGFLRVIKVILYFFLFAFFTACLVINKGTLLFMTSTISNSTLTNQVRAYIKQTRAFDETNSAGFVKQTAIPKCNLKKW